MTDIADRHVTVPVETVTPIKPSEAIRLGCLTTVQGFGFVWGTDEDGTPRTGKHNGQACVMGAAILGGFTPDAFWRGHSLPCPACDRRPCADLGTPAHLNDDHRWPRERIADWLEGIGL